MKLLVFAVGHRQPDWVVAGCDEYRKRMPREMPLQITEIKPEPRGSKNREQLLAAEKGRLREAMPGNCRNIILDERGDDLATLQLARRLEHWQADGRDVALLIGGPDGIDETLKAAADERIRLSSLTLPHGLARLLLCEQLYRAASVLKNHPYHREG